MFCLIPSSSTASIIPGTLNKEEKKLYFPLIAQTLPFWLQKEHSGKWHGYLLGKYSGLETLRQRTQDSV